MSITSPDNRTSTYNPVVATTEFPAGFPVFDNDDIAVFHDGVERVDFAVSATYIEGVSTDAKAVFAVGITGKVEVVGVREPRRTSLFQNGGPLPIRDQNLALNTIVAEIQEARRDIDRAFKSPFGIVPPAVPQPSDQTVIGWVGGNLANIDPAEFVKDAGFATAAQGVKADGAAQKAQNLADLTDAAEASKNLGLGTANTPTFAGLTLSTSPISSPGLPNLSTNVQGTGMPGLDGAQWFLWSSPSTFDPKPTLRVDRHVNDGAGGVAANTYSALWVLASSDTVGEGYEWAGLFQFHNKTAKTSNAENLALNSTSFIDNEALEVGKTWSANFALVDNQGTPNPEKGRVSVEIDNYCLPTGGTDNNRARVGIQLAFGTANGVAPNPGTPLHFGRGLLIGSNQADVIIDRLMEVSGPGSFDIGIDTTAATFTKPVLFMKEGQRVSFDGDTAGNYNRSLFYSAGQLAYQSPSGVVFGLSDSGALNINGALSNNGVAVVGSRKTGWTSDPTGTLTRTTFATGSVTLPQLAERVAALIVDLRAHGLIGA